VTLLILFMGAYGLLCGWAHLRAPVGTRSVLYGYHCVLIHWMFVARGWYQLYKWDHVLIGTLVRHDNEYGATYRRPVLVSLRDPRLWLVFLIHDLGYWGKPNMDGPEGETHPEWACQVLNRWFGAPWGQFSLTHSRFYSKKMNMRVSHLCYADKLAIVYIPAWLMLPMVAATGEVKEYMKDSQRQNAVTGHPDSAAWLRDVKAYVIKWVDEHKDGKDDTWTPSGGQREPTYGNDTGVWK
jgi:hypothetical protein